VLVLVLVLVFAGFVLTGVVLARVVFVLKVRAFGTAHATYKKSMLPNLKKCFSAEPNVETSKIFLYAWNLPRINVNAV